MTIFIEPPDVEDQLEHFGVKGMHWGVRNEDPEKGFSKREKAILKAGKVSAADSAQINAKYGKDSLSKDDKEPRFSREQKAMAAKLVVAAGVAAGTWYLFHKLNQYADRPLSFTPHVPHLPNSNPLDPRYSPKNPARFLNEWNTYQRSAFRKEVGYSKEIVANLSTKPTNLKAGTILRRVSSSQESIIRKGGFYAAHTDADVERYKAILPVFWGRQQRDYVPQAGGYVVKLKANAAIKAPSERHTFNLFKSMLNDEVEVPSFIEPGGKRKTRFRDLFGHFGNDQFDDDSAARMMFPAASKEWINEHHPGTKHFFSKVKDAGYNALPDMNDSNALASKPLRVIDGSLFSIDGHDALSQAEIIKAQENLVSLAHLGLLFDAHATLFTDVFGGKEEYIEHFGIKGMKWGVRKPEETGPGRQAGAKRFGLSPNNQKAVAAAFAVGITVGAAVLAKKGANVTVWNSQSTKTLLRGANMSSKILGNTGKVLVKSSAKTATVGAKVGFKVGKVGGKLGGRLAIAGGKAAGRAAVQNGSRMYKEVLAPSARLTERLGSHAMFKLTGRGKPIVSEVVKSKASLNPIDILLNTRNDKTLFKNRGGSSDSN